MVGIYKIQSPTGRIYIGQSVNIKARWAEHKRIPLTELNRLYKSFLKYGVESHLFEVVEECLEINLSERERYWQDVYNVTGKKGLNCTLQSTQEKRGKLSQQVIKQRQATRQANGGYQFTKERNQKMAESLRGRKQTKEHIENAKQARLNKKIGSRLVKYPRLNITFDSIKQAANYFKCSREVIYGKIRRGELISMQLFIRNKNNTNQII